MSHVVIIVQQAILPPPDSQIAKTATGGATMRAEVTFTPDDASSEKVVGETVSKIVRRLARLADD